MSFTFLDAFSSVQSADSSVISGVVQRPIVNIGSVLSAIPVLLSGNASVSGTVQVTGSVVATIVGTPSISGSVTVVGSVVAGFVQPSILVSGVTSVITSASSVLVLVAPTSSQRNYVSNILVTNGSGTGTFVNIVDNGQIIYSGYAAASGGGFSAAFPVALKQPSSVLALYAIASTQASIIVSMSGYTAS